MASVYAGQTRKAHARGEPASLLVHEDILVFQKPQRSGLAACGESRSPRGAPARAAAQTPSSGTTHLGTAESATSTNGHRSVAAGSPSSPRP